VTLFATLYARGCFFLVTLQSRQWPVRAGFPLMGCPSLRRAEPGAGPAADGSRPPSPAGAAFDSDPSSRRGCPLRASRAALPAPGPLQIAAGASRAAGGEQGAAGRCGSAVWWGGGQRSLWRRAACRRPGEAARTGRSRTASTGISSSPSWQQRPGRCCGHFGTIHSGRQRRPGPERLQRIASEEGLSPRLFLQVEVAA